MGEGHTDLLPVAPDAEASDFSLAIKIGRATYIERLTSNVPAEITQAILDRHPEAMRQPFPTMGSSIIEDSIVQAIQGG